MFRTLIIEDNAGFRHALRSILRERFPDADVAEAANGEEALRSITAHEPDFIFMDIGLPGVNGLELTKTIKAAHPRIVVAIITNHDLPEYREAAAKNGASYFIPKEAAAEEVVAIVRAVCSRPAADFH